MSNFEHKLSNIFKNQTERICSLEISPRREINYSLLDSIPSSFCSVIWIGDYTKEAEQIEPLTTAAELIKRGHPTVLHIASRNVNKKNVGKYLDYAQQVGVRNLLVTRGASPETQMEDSKYDFPYSTHLIKFIRTKYGDYFDLAVPGYPYKHAESKTLEEDMYYLKQKNDAGAKFIFSQAAFSYDIYKTFHENCRKFNITMQVIPGVYLIQSVVDFCLLKKLCKVPTNDPVIQFIKDHKGSDDEIAEHGRKISKEIVKKIIMDKDFCPPHIYTMNDFEVIKDFIAKLN